MLPLLLNKLKEGLNKLNLSVDDRLGLAFSAGPDSVFLLVGLMELGYKNIYLLYVNYHDSPFVDQEENIVKFYCDKYQIELITKDVDFHNEKSGFENKARLIRYDFFNEESKKLQLKGLLTAHQEDDVIETYLMQKEKHAIGNYYGIAPLSKYKDLPIYRPMLNVSKADLIKALNDNSYQFYDDCTNKDLSRRRNYLRHTVLPEINRKELLEEIQNKNQQLETIKNDVNSMNNCLLNSYYYHLKDENKQKYLLYYFLKVQMNIDDSFNGAQKLLKWRNLLFEMLKNKQATNSYQLYEEFSFVRFYSYFSIVNNEWINIIPYSAKINNNGVIDTKQYQIKINNLDYFNVPNLSYPLYVKNLNTLPKDAKIAFNYSGSSLEEFLKKHKVPYFLRSTYPVLTDQEGRIIYIPNFEKALKGKDEVINFKSLPVEA